MKKETKKRHRHKKADYPELKLKSRELYMGGYSITEIAGILTVSPDSLIDWLDGIKRTRQEGLVLRMKKFRTKNEYSADGEITTIIAYYKGREFKVLIDTEDYRKIYDYPMKFTIANFKKSNSFYCKGSGTKNILLHRLIMGEPEGMVIDHINGNTLDNRKSNLRIVTSAENSQNQTRLNKYNKSGFPNVSWNTRRNKWHVQLTVNGNHMRLGYFENLEDAKYASAKARLIHIPHAMRLGGDKYYELAEESLQKEKAV